MEIINYNEEKKFECTNCKKISNWTIYKSKYDRFGYMCNECWNIFNERIRTIYFNFH